MPFVLTAPCTRTEEDEIDPSTFSTLTTMKTEETSDDDEQVAYTLKVKDHLSQKKINEL